MILYPYISLILELRQTYVLWEKSISLDLIKSICGFMYNERKYTKHFKIEIFSVLINLIISAMFLTFLYTLLRFHMND